MTAKQKNTCSVTVAPSGKVSNSSGDYLVDVAQVPGNAWHGKNARRATALRAPWHLRNPVCRDPQNPARLHPQARHERGVSEGTVK